jgi:predicted dehydrogenase
MRRQVAIVGCGLIGAKRAAALPDRWDLVAVHDVDAARAQALAAAHGAAEVVASADAAASRAGGDGLMIVATQHDGLVPAALAAVDGGCHVLVEKPGARSAAELQPLATAAQTGKRLVRVGFNHRFHPSVLAAAELLASRRYGEVLLIRARYGHGGRLGYEQEWRADPQRSGGGELLDQGVHLIDLCSHLAGPVALRYASLGTFYWDMRVEDNAFLHLDLAGAGQGWLHASWTEWRNLFSFEITCRTAKLEITGLGGSYGPERLTVYELADELGPPMTSIREWPPADDSWALELADVDAELDGLPSVGAAVDDALAVLGIVDEAYRR